MYSTPASTALPITERGIALYGSVASAPSDAAPSKPTKPSTPSTTAKTTPSRVEPLRLSCSVSMMFPLLKKAGTSTTTMRTIDTTSRTEATRAAVRTLAMVSRIATAASSTSSRIWPGMPVKSPMPIWSRARAV